MVKSIAIVKDITKNYDVVKAVKGILFTVKKCEIFSMLGPNGAGKITTFLVLSTLIKITGDKVNFAGKELEKKPKDIRKIVSYPSEDTGAYKNLTGREWGIGMKEVKLAEYLSKSYEVKI